VGTYGQVFKVLQQHLGIFRAMKEIHVSGDQSESERQYSIKQCENEWKILKELDHPGVCKLIDVFNDD
jgi:serine/threonine protein kinase